MKIFPRHLLGHDTEQIHHIAEAQLELIGRLPLRLRENAAHGIIRDLGIQPVQRHDRRLGRDIKLLELHIGVRHEVDICAAVHAALGDLKRLPLVRLIAVAVKRPEVDEGVRLEAVIQTVDRECTVAAAHEQERLVVIIDIERRRLDLAHARLDIAGQDIVDKIVMRAGQNGLLVLGAEKCRAG